MSDVVNTEPPKGLASFLAPLGWDISDVSILAADASFRRYFRAARGDGSRAVIMDAPPPHEDPRPFINMAEYLCGQGFRAPKIWGQNLDEGLVLLEDFGDVRMREYLDEHPDKERQIYQQAIDTLVRLKQTPAAPLAPYDLDAYMREVRLLTEWYMPAMNLPVDQAAFDAVWQAALAPISGAEYQQTTVLRDYHAENIMLLDDGQQGIIDFQDALAGHPAYDLVSLLQDARRDVSVQLEANMLEYYRSETKAGDDFVRHYALLGAQRNTKIIGIFTRLWQRDGKERYLSFLPRMWDYLERDLEQPGLEPLRQWFDANIPRDIRRKNPAEISAA
jgi:N-acetylmuramate 1-kinase